MADEADDLTLSAGEVRLTLRLPPYLRDDLRKQAIQNNRSLNGELLSRLHRSLRADPIPDDSLYNEARNLDRAAIKVRNRALKIRSETLAHFTAFYKSFQEKYPDDTDLYRHVQSMAAAVILGIKQPDIDLNFADFAELLAEEIAREEADDEDERTGVDKDGNGTP